MDDKKIVSSDDKWMEIVDYTFRQDLMSAFTVSCMFTKNNPD